MPLASASLLALAITLAGCGEDKATPPAATAPVASSASALDPAASKAVVAHYAALASAVFNDAASTGKALQSAVDALLAAPSEATLSAARTAWLAARVPYMQSEVFRFGNGVVDDWEGQLNAWPLDEGLIDYVASNYPHALGNPGATANIIARSPFKAMVVATVICLISIWGGLVISAMFPAPPSFIIVTLSTLFWAIAKAVETMRK